MGWEFLFAFLIIFHDVFLNVHAATTTTQITCSSYKIPIPNPAILNLFHENDNSYIHFCFDENEILYACHYIISYKIEKISRVYENKGCDAFGPKPIWCPDFWSPTSCRPGQTILIKLIPLDKWSPTNSVPLEKWSPKIWSPWTNGIFYWPFVQEDQISWGPFVHGDRISGDHLSRGPINWGPIVGDQMSGDHMHLGPNVSQPIPLPWL